MSWPLIPSWSMPWLENPELKRQIQEDNDRYKQEQENATPEKTRRLKEEAWELFWKWFNPEENIVNVSKLEEKEDFENPDDILTSLENDQNDSELNLNNSNESLENQDKLLTSNSPYFPLLQRLNSVGEISKEKFEESVIKINSMSKEESTNYFLSLADNIENNDVRENIVWSFEKNTEIDESNFEETDFFKDWTDLKINIDKWVWWLEIMLAQNYISIPDQEWNTNKATDINQSMDITLNTIITNNSKDFEQNNWVIISEIKSETNINTKYELLKTLYKEDLKEDAKIGWKKWLEETRRKKQSLKERAKKISEELENARKVQDDKKREEQLQDLNIQKQEIIDEANWVDNFEAEISSLAWWEVDKASESNETTNKN